MSLGTAEPTHAASDPTGAAATADAAAAGDSTDQSADAAPSPSPSPWLVRAALALALLPLGVSVVNLVVGVGSDYRPIGDQAMQEMHVRDVGHHEVLVGLWSHPQWSHPGPVFFYLTAPVYWLTGHASIAMSLTTLAVGAGSIAGVAVIARRRAGTPLMLCTLLGSSLLVWSFGPDFLRDPWVTYVPTLPFALLIFLVWALVAGETWALPVTAFVASFLIQTHIGFLALAAPLAGVGALWLLVPGLRDPGRRRTTVRAVALSAAVMAVVWLPPVLDVILHHPSSNVSRTQRWFENTSYQPHGLRDGWRVVASQFGWPPPWLSESLGFNGAQTRYMEDGLTPVVLVAVLAAGAVLWRRRPVGGRRMVAVFGLALAAGVITVARTLGNVAEYRLGWIWVLAMLGFVLVAWAVWLLAAAAGERRMPWLEGRLLVPATLVGLAVLAVVNGLDAARAGAPYAGDGRIVGELLGPMLDEVDPDEGQVVVLEAHNGAGVPLYARGLVLQLEKRGIDARVPRPHMPFFSRSRVQRDGPVQAFFYVSTGADEIAELKRDPGYRLVTEWRLHTPEEEAEMREILDEMVEDLEAGTFDIEDFESPGPVDQIVDAPAFVPQAAVFLDLTPPTT